MKTFLLTGTLALLTGFSLIGIAQEAAKPAGAGAAKATPAADKPDPSKTDGTKKGRLPANYGKLGLTEAQKTKIYGVQGKYEEQLDALEKQLDTVKGKRDQEVEAVLTEDQRKILKNLVDANKEAKAKPKTGEKDDDATKTDAPKKEEKK